MGGGRGALKYGNAGSKYMRWRLGKKKGVTSNPIIIAFAKHGDNTEPTRKL